MTGNLIRVGVLGSGSGTNCEALLAACAAGTIPAKVVLVLSDVADAPILDRARHRGIAAKFIGKSLYRSKLEPELEQRVVKLLQEADVDLVALAGYLRIVKEPLLNAFAGRIINVHPALLPSFPGLKAWEQAFAYGAKVTGATVHFVDHGVDTGPIILQEAVPILAGDTAATVHARIQTVEHKLYPAAVGLFAIGKLRVAGRRVEILP